MERKPPFGVIALSVLLVISETFFVLSNYFLVFLKTLTTKGILDPALLSATLRLKGIFSILSIGGTHINSFVSRIPNHILRSSFVFDYLHYLGLIVSIYIIFSALNLLRLKNLFRIVVVVFSSLTVLINAAFIIEVVFYGASKFSTVTFFKIRPAIMSLFVSLFYALYLSHFMVVLHFKARVVESIAKVEVEPDVAEIVNAEEPRNKWISVVGFFVIADALFRLLGVRFDTHSFVFSESSKEMIMFRYCFSAGLRILLIGCGLGIILRKNFLRKMVIFFSYFTIISIYWRYPFSVVQSAVSAAIRRVSDPSLYQMLYENFKLFWVSITVCIYIVDVGFAVFLIYFLTKPKVEDEFTQKQ